MVLELSLCAVCTLLLKMFILLIDTIYRQQGVQLFFSVFLFLWWCFSMLMSRGGQRAALCVNITMAAYAWAEAEKLSKRLEIGMKHCSGS